MTSLKHVGVLGMKWGVRKRGPASKEHATAREIKKKHVSELSNDELRTVITRLQLEKQYKDISSASASRGQKFVSQLIQRVGAQAINQYASGKVNPAFVAAFTEFRNRNKN